MNAGHIFAEIISALAAGPAKSAGAGPVDRDELSGQQVRHACANRVDLAGRFRTNHQRHLALGECHAAPAPDIDVVERDRLDTHRHLAAVRRRRRRKLDLFQPAIVDQL